MKEQIEKMFKGAAVSDVAIDTEFGNVTATVNGKKNVDCGFIEDFE
jgi:molybdopterin-binding protein